MASISLTVPIPNRSKSCFSTAFNVSKTPLHSTALFPKSHPPPFIKTQTLSPPPRSAASAATIASAAIGPHQTQTQTQTLKSRLHNGETLYGMFLLSFSPTLAEIAGLAGYDFVVVDMEHGHGGVSATLPCLHALAAANTPAVLRLPESSPTWAKKALDLGPQGLMFPMVETPESARHAVSYCRFPPAGVRGSAHTVVRASGYGIDAGYLSCYEEELLIMCQVESQLGVENVEEIAAVNGVDCIQMGPLDLSASLGYLWDPGHRKVREVMRAAEKLVLAGSGGSGAYLAGFTLPHDGPEDLRARGYHMVSGAVDVGLFRSAAVEDVKKFKMGTMQGYSVDEDEGGDGKEDTDEKYWSE